MIILGVGIDIENISRFRKLPYKKKKYFYDKIFTKAEIKYCLDKSDPYPHFAARFSAKEAVIKSLPKPVHPKNIEISIKSDNINVRVKGRKNLKVFVSMTHTKEFSAAIALTMR